MLFNAIDKAEKLMASLGFAACLQELLSNRKERKLLNFFRLRNLNNGQL